MPRLAVSPDGSAVQLYEGPGEREADSHPGMPARRGSVRLAKALEDVGQLVFRDADAVVLDADEITFGFPFQADDDPPVPRRELDRVGEQVPEDLLEAQGGGAHHRHRLPA